MLCVVLYVTGKTLGQPAHPVLYHRLCVEDWISSMK